MKKLKKFAVAFGIAGMLVSGVGAANPVDAAWSNVEQSHYEKGILIGWADGNSFEVKASSGKYMVFRSSNDWYKKNLLSGKSYTYYYYTNKYGQNIITKIQK